MSVTSPFTASTTDNTTIELDRNHKLVLRVDDTAGAKVLVKVGTSASASVADYFLLTNEALEVVAKEKTTVNILSSVGTPKVYWAIEPTVPLHYGR